MTESVWFIAKPGEERKFASPKAPSPEWAASLRKQGYIIMRVEFFLPAEFDTANHTRRATLTVVG